MSNSLARPLGQRSATTMVVCTLAATVVAIALFAYQANIIGARISSTFASTTLAAATFVSLAMTPFLVVASAVMVAIALGMMAASVNNISVSPPAALRTAFIAELGRFIAASLLFVARANTADPATTAGTPSLLGATFTAENLVWAVLLFWLLKRFTNAGYTAALLVCGGVLLLRSSLLLLRFVAATV